MNVKLETLPKRAGSTLTQVLVRREDTNEIVGLLEKFRDDRGTKNPWKAFKGIGESIEYIGAYYSEDGGKDAAVRAIKYFNK